MFKRKRSETSTPDVGLEAGMAFSRFFLNTEHLHYGLWQSGETVSISSLRRAQDRYTETLLSHIPEGAKTVLDVGCGSGCHANRLSELGYHVECVSPSPFLTREAFRLTRGKIQIHECRFEDFQTDGAYDVVLFSESFQYVELATALTRSEKLLRDGGHVIICDIFRKDTTDKCLIGGGHRLSKFLDRLGHSSLVITADVDLTQQAMPTIDLANRACLEVLAPVWASVERYFNSAIPRLSRLVRWKFRKRLEKVKSKYLSGERTGEHFARHKSYRLFVLQKHRDVSPHSAAS